MTPVWIFAAVLAAGPATNSHLASAEDLIANVNYGDAEKALSQARADPGNSRETLLRILELQGTVAGTLGQGTKARDYFRALLTLDPAHKLPDGQPPRVKGPFYEAKGMVSEAPAMIFAVTAEPGRLSARVSADPVLMAKRVRFHVRAAGVWTVTDLPLVSGAATAPLPDGAAWWAELLGDADGTLLEEGSEAHPLGADAPARAEEPPPLVSSGPPLRFSPPVVGLVVGGGAALLAGIVCGALSASNFGTLNGAPRDASGVTVSLTQRQAASLQSTGKSEAIAANVLLVLGVAAAGSGVALWYFHDRDATVALVPGPGGLAIAGVFP